LQRKREHAIRLLEQGLTQAEIARSLDVDPRSVRRWKHDLKQGGWAALRAARRCVRSLQSNQELLRSFIQHSPLSLRLR